MDFYHRERNRHRGFSDIESLLVDASDVEDSAEIMSLHSNIGDPVTPRRKKRRSKKKGMKLFGLNFFGHRPIQLPVSDDEVDYEDTRARRTSRNGSLLNHSSSTLDSDAAPLSPEDIARLTSSGDVKADASITMHDDSEVFIYDEHQKIRRERDLASQTLAMSPGEGEFEGFQGSGHYANIPSPLSRENNTSSNVFSASTLYGQAARLFEAYVQSATSGLPSASSSDEQGEIGYVDDDMPDCDIESSSRASGSGSSASGSNSHSHTSHSQTSYDNHSPYEVQHNSLYLTSSQLMPHTPMSATSDRFDDAASSVYYTPSSETNVTPHRRPPKKAKNKSRSSKNSSSSSSQSPSIASPTPIQPAFNTLTSVRTDDSDLPTRDNLDTPKKTGEGAVGSFLD